MGYQNEVLWDVLVKKSAGDFQFLSGVETVCNFAISRALTTRDTFPNFTLHDETHVCNVLRLMSNLLGDRVECLETEEAAMLILAACCHDIGMSYSANDKQAILNDLDRLSKYLDQNPREYVKAYSNNAQLPNMTDEMIRDYFRTIHHERVRELLIKIEWPDTLRGRVDRDYLIRVCQSHCQSHYVLDDLKGPPSIDLRMCAILLRLADILDFDITRAPKSLYNYQNISSYPQSISYIEWEKHLSSAGFKFNLVDRRHPYLLPYSATCSNMQIEQTIRNYLDWVDNEFIGCSELLRNYDGRWKDIILPAKTDRHIEAINYISGNYCITLDHSKVLELLSGKNLYDDPFVFVRELLQNAIDAVRTRKELDKLRPKNWKPQIYIRTWLDSEGFHWFRIEDNGIGMNEQIIQDYLLKIGSSYYQSDEFRREKLRMEANPDYTPISRFGIGFLSCFLGGDRIIISTKRYNHDGINQPALRLQMCGLSGYYYLANRNMGHSPGPMVGQSDDERVPYLNHPGTIIAVRTSLHKAGIFKGFKEIIEKYLAFPPVAVHYSGPDGECDFCTETDLIHELSTYGRIDYALSFQQQEIIRSYTPGLTWIIPPKIIVQCITYNDFYPGPYLSGGAISIWAEWKTEGEVVIYNNNRSISAYPDLSLEFQDNEILLKVDFKPKDRNIFLARNLSKDTIWQHNINAVDIEVYCAMKCGLLHISNVDNYICQKYSISKLQLADMIAHNNSLKEFSEKEKDGVIPTIKMTFDISRENWYRKIIEKNKQIHYLTYNGIIVSKNQDPWDVDETILTPLWNVLILHDKLCPEMDISRTRILSLPNKFNMVWLLILQRIINRGIQYVDIFSDKDYFYPRSESLSDWTISLNSDTVVQDTIKIPTNKGALTVFEISQALSKGDYITAEIITQYSLGKEEALSTLYLVVLQNFFSCCIIRGPKIVIGLRKEKIVDNKLLPFPPLYFMEYDESVADKLLCCNNCYCPLNIAHPFSQWLLANYDILNEKAPGILNGILRHVSRSVLMYNINDLLNMIRNIPNIMINVPDSIFINESDIEDIKAIEVDSLTMEKIQSFFE
jgi:hypothetical protein